MDLDKKRLGNLIRDNQIELFNRERQLFFNPGQLSDIRSDHVARYELASQSIKKDDKVLDIAMGAAYGGLVLPCHYWGIEKSEYAIEMARICVSPFRDKSRVTEFMQRDISKIVSPNYHYDWPQFTHVTCFETFEHLDETLHVPFLQFLYNILAPHGELFLSCPLVGPDNEMHSIAGHHKKEYGYSELEGLILQYFPKILGIWSQSKSSEYKPVPLVKSDLFNGNFSFPGPRNVVIVIFHMKRKACSQWADY